MVLMLKTGWLKCDTLKSLGLKTYMYSKSKSISLLLSEMGHTDHWYGFKVATAAVTGQIGFGSHLKISSMAILDDKMIQIDYTNKP